MNDSVVLIMGPTASGKTNAALALAQSRPVEIISVDSALVYRGMDIGTAKPDARTRRRVAHHLIDIIDPTEVYSAAQFADDASQLIRAIIERGNTPVLVGGTMLYFKALREGLSNLPPADPTTRMVIDAMAEDAGWPGMHKLLADLDPETAQRLDPNDSQRIQRALEVAYVSGRTMSALIAEGRNRPPEFNTIAVSLEPSDRGVLHERIATRFEDMLELGLISEVRQLRSEYALSPELPSMRSVGYRQVWHYLDGEFGLATLREKAIAATRQLAKRQLTWLRQTKNVERFDALREDVADRVVEYVAAAIDDRTASNRINQSA